RRVDTLSGGQQQRVAVARMLMQRPRIVLADEPVTSLDPSSANTVLELLTSVATEGVGQPHHPGSGLGIDLRDRGRARTGGRGAGHRGGRDGLLRPVLRRTDRGSRARPAGGAARAGGDPVGRAPGRRAAGLSAVVRDHIDVRAGILGTLLGGAGAGRGRRYRYRAGDLDDAAALRRGADHHPVHPRGRHRLRTDLRGDPAARPAGGGGDMTRTATPMRSTTINRFADRPLYRQLSEVLEARLIERARPGDRLPSEAELSGQFGVNRLTVRRALHELAQRGIIETVHGRGSFVARQPVRYRLSATRDASFTRGMRELGHPVRIEVLGAETTRCRRLRTELHTAGEVLTTTT